MISPDVLSVVERRAVESLDDRRAAFAYEINQLWGKQSANGVLQSGSTISQTLDAIGNEFRVRAQLIWHAFAQAFDAAKMKISETVALELKQRLSDLLDNGSSDLSANYERTDQIMPGVAAKLKSLDELRSAAVERVSTDIDYAVLKHSVADDSGQGFVKIYQSVGIIQTGAGASASLSIRLGGEERREIETAIEAVREALEQSASLSPAERTQSLDLVSDVKKELQAEQPNRYRIRGALAALATTIQTLSAVPQAYRLLKGAAALVGLDLP
jgi:hypothetical protein